MKGFPSITTYSSLSQGRQSVDDEGTCEMHQPQIALHPLLKANEEFPEPIMPAPLDGSELVVPGQQLGPQPLEDAGRDLRLETTVTRGAGPIFLG